MQKPTERLTRKEMAEKYPNTWLGITNVKYVDDDGVTLESADIIYTDKSRRELMSMQIKGTGIRAWFTNENGMPLGLVGVDNGGYDNKFG